MFRNRRYSRFSRRIRRKGATVSKIASGRVKKPSQVQTLAKAVKRLQLANYHRAEPQFIAVKNQQSVIQPYNTFRCTPNAAGVWTNVFGTSTADWTDANKIMWKSCGLDMYFTHQNLIGNEEENVSYTVFLVSLTKEASELLPLTNGAISDVGGASAIGITMTEGLHYHAQSTGIANIGAGFVMLNKKYFKIHKVKRFVLGNNNQSLDLSSAQKQYGIDYRLYWKFAPRKMISPPGGNAGSASHRDPVDQYHVLVFSSNANADLENPQWYINAVNTFVPYNS